MLRSMNITSLKRSFFLHHASTTPNLLFLNLPDQGMLNNVYGTFIQNQPGITLVMNQVS